MSVRGTTMNGNDGGGSLLELKKTPGVDRRTRSGGRVDSAPLATPGDADDSRSDSLSLFSRKATELFAYQP